MMARIIWCWSMVRGLRWPPPLDGDEIHGLGHSALVDPGTILRFSRSPLHLCKNAICYHLMATAGSHLSPEAETRQKIWIALGADLMLRSRYNIHETALGIQVYQAVRQGVVHTSLSTPAQ